MSLPGHPTFEMCAPFATGECGNLTIENVHSHDFKNLYVSKKISTKKQNKKCYIQLKKLRTFNARPTKYICETTQFFVLICVNDVQVM